MNNDNVLESYKLGLKLGASQPLMSIEDAEFMASVNVDHTMTDTELLSIAMQSKTAVEKDHSFPLYVPDEQGELEIPGWFENRAVELARIHIPAGHFALLRRIDTAIIDATTGNPIQQWDNPSTWDNFFKFVLCYNNRLDPNVPTSRYAMPLTDAGSSVSWKRFAGTLALPPIGSWNDGRYAWGNPSNEIAVPLPKHSVVRLFIVCTQETPYKHRVQGKLTYTTQSEASLSAAWRARRAPNG